MPSATRRRSAVFSAPTRRTAALYPFHDIQPANYNQTAAVAKTDYAANGGDWLSNPAALGIWSANCGNGDCGPPASSPPSSATIKTIGNQVLGSGPNSTGPSGIIAAVMLTTQADVRDGLANTYLVGEKYLQPELYMSGSDPGDNDTIFAGDNQNITRYTVSPPLQDHRGQSNPTIFGSPHAAGFTVCMGDLSVRPISYSINPLAHQYLGNKADGQAVQPPAY